MSPATATKVKRIKTIPGVKTCPFCGGNATISRYKADPPEMPKPWWIVSCCMNNPCTSWPQTSGESRDEAIANWNTRA